MLIVGLTGQTGAGKSTVGALLQAADIPVIDCDRVSREVVQPDSECLKALVNAFSPEILTPDGTLDRRRLGGIVFSDSNQLRLLNQTIFPFIRLNIEDTLHHLSQKGYSLAVLDAPTLFESGMDQICGYIIAVVAKQSIRCNRIIARDGITSAEAVRRMESQLSEDFFRRHCDCLIENNHNTELLSVQTNRLITLLKERTHGNQR